MQLAGACAELLAATVISVAFFYGKPLPVDGLARFDWVVVEPDNTRAEDLKALKSAGVEVFAYLSLGETRADVDPRWMLGRNAGWNTAIVDPSSEGWRRRILERVDLLEQRGFDGLFLDTLDSYAIVLEGDRRSEARGAMVRLIRSIHQRAPRLKSIFNRGFELLDDTGDLAAGIAAESLFFGWDPAAKRYAEVSASDRDWLAEQLRRATQKLGIPGIAIDYLPELRRSEAREAARRIESMGFIPWIATPSLDSIGIGNVHPESPRSFGRRVLLLYDGAEMRTALLEVVIERLRSIGFTADPLDVRGGLPPSVEHRAVVTWFTDDELPGALDYPRWLSRRIESGVRVVILGRPGVPLPEALLAKVGLAAERSTFRIARIAEHSAVVDLGPDPAMKSRGLLRWRADRGEVTVHLRVEDGEGRAIDPVLTAPWGGLALQPYLFETGYQGRIRWIVDLAEFLAIALGDDE